MPDKSEAKYLSSKEAKAVLRVQDCDLTHIRNSGKLKFTKRGNAFLYSIESINDLIKINKQKRI